MTTAPDVVTGPHRVWAPSALLVSSALLTAAVLLGNAAEPQVHVVLVLGACLGYVVMVETERRWGGLGIRLVAIVTVVQGLAALWRNPVVTHDIWWYNVFGRILAVHHVSPYTHSAADFPFDATIRHAGHAWQHMPSVYGPLFTGVSGLIVLVTDGSFLATRLLYQVLALAAVGVAALVIWRTTRRASSVAFLTVHPLVALYLVNGGRNDIIVGLALLGSVVLTARRHDVFSGVAGGLGCLVKLTCGIGMAALVASQARRGRSSAVLVASTLVVLGAGYSIAGPHALFTPMKSAGSMFSALTVWRVTHGIIAPHPRLALVVFLLVVVLAMVRYASTTPQRCVTATVTAGTLSAAWALPGYAAWALPTAALDEQSPVSRIAAGQGVLLVAAYAILRNPIPGALGAALSRWTVVVAPFVLLILLVRLLVMPRTPSSEPAASDLPVVRPIAGDAIKGTQLVVIPTYNERDNIDAVLRRTRAAAPTVDILVVDDASPDGTADRATDLARELGHIRVLRREGARGLGPAYRDGFRCGLDLGYDVIAEMDADLSHEPEALPRVLERASRGAALTIGSRAIPGGTTVDWPRRRRALSGLGSRYAAWMLGIPARDVTSGFRAYRADALRRVDLDAVRSNGYGFQIEMAYRVAQTGGAIAEVPITFRDRVAGQSKLSSAIVVEALWFVTREGVSGARGRPSRRSCASGGTRGRTTVRSSAVARTR